MKFNMQICATFSPFLCQVAKQIFLTGPRILNLGISEALFRQEIYDINHGRMVKENACYYRPTMAGLPWRFARFCATLFGRGGMMRPYADFFLKVYANNYSELSGGNA